MRILFVMRLWDFLKSLSGTEEFVNSLGDMKAYEKSTH